MPLEGSVFLALWNDFDPARDDEYECWHTFEHVPERVGVPGILRGRRYRAAERVEDRFFTLYEVVDRSVLGSAPYLDLVKHPTDWSREMRPSFRNVSRSPCETLVSVGRGMGGAVATARVVLERPLGPAEMAHLNRLVIEIGNSLPATAFHIGQAIDELLSYPVFEGSQSARDGHSGLSLTLVAEATDRHSALDSLHRIGDGLGRSRADARLTSPAAYDLVFTVRQAELERPGNRRLPPRPELRSRFSTTLAFSSVSQG